MISTDPRRVLLVRHGRTALNAEGRLRGLADPALDPLGLEQARATAARLRDLGIRAVLTSPLRRARQTAQAIADACGVEVTMDERFTDRDYGPWTGHVRAEVIRRWGGVDAAPGVEPVADVLVRAMSGLTGLTETGDRSTVAVVTHDAVIRPLLDAIKPGIRPLVETGSWAELDGDSIGWRVVSYDNIAV